MSPWILNDVLPRPWGQGAVSALTYVQSGGGAGNSQTQLREASVSAPNLSLRLRKLSPEPHHPSQKFHQSCPRPPSLSPLTQSVLSVVRPGEWNGFQAGPSSMTVRGHQAAWPWGCLSSSLLLWSRREERESASVTWRLSQDRMTLGAGDKSRGCCRRIIKSGLQGGKERKEMVGGGEVMVGEQVGEPPRGGVSQGAFLGEGELVRVETQDGTVSNEDEV